jgi:acyl-CoA reductase-like NAD-dependent aldehyde dehydrogenase
MAIESINPATEEVEARFDELTPAQVEAALQAAASAYRAWSRTSFDERGALFHRAAERLRADKDRYAGLITAEMGKPIVEAEAEVEKCAWNCEFYAEHAAGFLTEEQVETPARLSYVAFDPLGVVLAVMPWNFPFWQVFRAAAPAMMAGNTCVLKHASNVPRCALAVEEVFREAGFPEGAFRTLLVSARAVDAIIADARIRAVTLTGSDVAGREVAAAAGRALKKSVLELGGSDPFIVLDDADLDAAAETAARARFQNTGQSCIAAKRFLVLDRVAAEFEERFQAATARLRVGDPRERETQIGPMARGDLRDALEHQLRASVDQGARVLTGGTRLEGRGYFFAPTVLADVQASMPVMNEETFGPLAAVYRVRDDDEAVQVANSSRFGLGSSVFTRDYERGQRLARRIESGLVFINNLVASDPRLPFGGVKDSGYGRELSTYGIREFVNVKTLWITDGDGTQLGDIRIVPAGE